MTFPEMLKVSILIFTISLDVVYVSTLRCRPRKTLVLTDPEDARYMPYHFELMRCAGASKHPHHHRCHPTKTTPLRVNVTNMNVYPYKTESIELINHVECKETCVCEACGADKETARERATCRKSEVWNSQECRCVSRCVIGHVGGRGGEEISTIELKVLIISLIVEFVLLMFIFGLGFRCYVLSRSQRANITSTDIYHTTISERQTLTNGIRGHSPGRVCRLNESFRPVREATV